jgi:hypothetical protein
MGRGMRAVNAVGRDPRSDSGCDDAVERGWYDAATGSDLTPDFAEG